MSFKLTRKTSWFGSATGMEVYINDEEAGKIRRLEEQHYKLPKKRRRAVLTVSQQGMKSNALEVEDGDDVLVKTNKKYSRIFTIFFVALMAVIFFIDDFLTSTAFIVFLAMAVFYYLSKIDGFILEKVSDEQAGEP
ncbi:hypothetical protein [Lacicoccus alkaliphilus]|uniref:Uncharacterized protein n=1 Tax=Lacicoccus alkaliphilus DSM 16010 TaxID=1123231 RepID=A0A1M7IYI5_9BACL|nr:hypothetical protein [Salinicoccus alkaliphilus]SHM45806.1 hypothetical protein SAMN02745189_02200 [Salinicoccus alkaliphilus DSM 16010]